MGTTGHRRAAAGASGEFGHVGRRLDTVGGDEGDFANGAGACRDSGERASVALAWGAVTTSETHPATPAPPCAPGEDPVASAAPDRTGTPGPGGDERLPVKMLNDRILVRMSDTEGERRTSGGILIPATAQVGKRLAWAQVVAVGPNVRNMEPGDQVLFNPEDRYEVEVRGHDYIILRERDVHAVAAERLDQGSTGLYL